MKEISETDSKAGWRRYNRQQQLALRSLAKYACDFLAQPHQGLGRDGNVCPFIPIALEKDLFRGTVTDAKDMDRVQSAMDLMRNVFLHMHPESPSDGAAASGDQIYKSIIVGFPKVTSADAPQIIDVLQHRLKAQYIRNGLMIGQFHPQCAEPGLHSSSFRPLQAPVPSLAIRHITRFDAPFMLESTEYVEGYVSRFGAEGKRRLELQMSRKDARGCPARP
jgi:hypothetical protein